MKYKNLLFLSAIFFQLSGCAIAENKPTKLVSAYAVPGTNTAVVGIGLDRKGVPLETVKEVVLKPGQKVVFAGPDKFDIVFKNRKTPTQLLKYESSGDGVVSIVIPRDILKRPEFLEEYKKNKFLTFNYAIRSNGKELDPPLIVKPDD